MNPVPFLAGQPVSGRYFVGRERTLKTIDTIMAGTADGAINNVMLLGPRRIGKSSILLSIKNRHARNPRVVPVMINAEGTPTKRRFADAYMTAVLDSYEERARRSARKKKLGRAVSRSLRSAMDSVSELDLTVLECVKFGAKLDKRKTEQDGLLEHALQFPEKLGRERGLAFLVMIDEFQALLKWGSPFLHLLRKTVQSQTHVAYILAGSAPSMMRGVVSDAKSPFYRQLHEVRVDPLPDSTALSYLARQLKPTGIALEAGTAQKICRLSRGIPDYLQRLAMLAYTACVVRDGASITDSDVESSYSCMLTHLDPVFALQFDSLTDLEKDVLLAVSRSHDTVSAMADDMRAQTTAMPRALSRLLGKDLVERRGRGRYAISDGVFADWLAHRYKYLDL